MIRSTRRRAPTASLSTVRIGGRSSRRRGCRACRTLPTARTGRLRLVRIGVRRLLGPRVRRRPGERRTAVVRHAHEDVVVTRSGLDAVVQRLQRVRIPARRGAAGLLRIRVEVGRERHDDLRWVRRIDRSRRVVRCPEHRVGRRPLLRHAGAARVGVLVGEAVGQLVEVAHDDRLRERAAAVGRLREQHLVVVVSGARRVRRRGVVVRPHHVQVPVRPRERLRERVLVALAVRRRRSEDGIGVDTR